MKIYLSSDHGGFELKNALREHLAHQGHEVEDLGPDTLDKDDDYTDYAFKTTAKLLGDEDAEAKAILICRSGQGMAMAANRVRGIRASVVWTERVAKETRDDNNSNVLSLPSDYITEDEAFKITDAWLSTSFSGEERHQRRLDEVEQLYG